MRLYNIVGHPVGIFNITAGMLEHETPPEALTPILSVMDNILPHKVTQENAKQLLLKLIVFV